MTATVLQCRGLTLQRDGRPVVTDVDLDVPAGSVTALLGPNGAGKTTIMQGLCGLLPLADGRVVLGEDDVSRWRPIRRARAGLAVVEQGRTLFTRLSTEDNLRIGSRSATAVDEALTRFPELSAKLSTRAGLLSGGEQQMVMLARSLARRPRVLLVDEMSLGLAPVVVRRILPLIRDLAADEGIGVLLVEQFATLALEVAEHAYVLRQGRLTYTGPAAVLAADPARLDEAYFGSDRSPGDAPAPGAL